MKTLVLWVIGAVLVLVAPLALATTSVTFDGQWWASHGSGARLLLIEGELDGAMTQCYKVVEITSFLYAYRNQQKLQKKLTKVWLKTEKRWSTHCSYSKKFGIYENLVSNFYMEYPDANKTRVGQIIACYNDFHSKHHTEESCISNLEHH